VLLTEAVYNLYKFHFRFLTWAIKTQERKMTDQIAELEKQQDWAKGRHAPAKQINI